MTSIGSGAFSMCSGLTQIIFEETKGWMAGDIKISSEDLVKSSTAAEYLKKKYETRTWKRSA